VNAADVPGKEEMNAAAPPGAPAPGWSGLARLPVPQTLGRCALFGAAAASLMLFFCSLAHYSALPAYVLDNALKPRARLVLLGLLAAALLGGSGLAAAWIARGGGERVGRWAQRLAPFTLLGPLPSLLCWRIWFERELELALIASAYAALAHAALLAGREGWAVPLERAAGAMARWRAGAGARALEHLPLALVLVAASGYAAYFAHHTIAYHRSGLTLSWDLGLEDNLVWNVLHGGPFMKSAPLAGPVDSSHFGYHATLFAYVLAPFYALWPRAEGLLLIQAILIAAAAIPLYLFAARRLSRAAACAVALAYLAYPAVHGANLYDFHYLPIGIVFLWLTLYAVDAERYRLAAVAALLTLSIREDMAADLAVLGGFIVLATPRVRAGLCVLGVAGVYFVVMKLGVMPRFLHGGESFVWQWQGLAPAENQGFAGVLMTLFGNPLFALRKLLEQQKLLYVLQLAAPLAFLPWRRPIGLWLSIPGFLFTLLTVDAPPLIQISFQYTAHWVGFVFVGLVVTLEALGRPRYPGDARGPIRRHAALATVLLLTLITTYQYGAILQRHTVRGGFAPYKFGWTAADAARYAGLRRLIDQVPPDAKIAASEYLVPHVSNRADAYTLRLGLYDAEYLLFQLDPRYNDGTQLPKSFWPREKHNLRAALGADFGVLAREGPYVLARRGHATSRNAATLAEIR
jgi:uncharacterized membrane protein